MSGDNGRGFKAPTYKAVEANDPTGVGAKDTYVLPSDDRQIDPDNDGDVEVIPEFAGLLTTVCAPSNFDLNGNVPSMRYKRRINESSYDRISESGGSVSTSGTPGAASESHE